MNPTYDGLYDQMLRAFEVAPRQQIQVQLNKVAAEDLATLPMYYTPHAVMVRKGVTGYQSEAAHAAPDGPDHLEHPDLGHRAGRGPRRDWFLR